MNGYHSRNYNTILIKTEDNICFIRMNRHDYNNSINTLLVEEMNQALDEFQDEVKIIVIEGLPETFCSGADFDSVAESNDQYEDFSVNPNIYYDLLMKLCNGPFISIAHVKGKSNAGGIGIMAAFNIVLADEKEVFSLSEMLFGLLPACVFPFLSRRIGIQKSNYMTLMTKPFDVHAAYEWGLVDAYQQDNDEMLRKHLLRLNLLNKRSIAKFKTYTNRINNAHEHLRSEAIK